MFIKRSKYQQIIDSYEEKIRNAEDVIAQMHSKYDGIEDVESEIACRRSKFEKEAQELQELKEQAIKENENIITRGRDLQNQYEEAHKLYIDLRKSVELYETRSEEIDSGIYVPIYDFQTQEEYKKALEKVIDDEKYLIKIGLAALCDTSWEVGGSRAKGESMTKKEITLSLRAFNGECDAIIAKVKWNNYETCQKKIKDSFARINKLQSVNTVHITDRYLEAKLKELTLTHEFELLKYRQKEEERERREEQREEQKALRELERERERAEKEEAHYAAALAKVKKEIEKATGVQYEKLSEKIQYLEEELAAARADKERALSMAQQTRCGYVYIISNIGSFGEGVFKIGMTRRLDPEDRIRELSNASVPFKYDIHAMIYSEDAPALEALLHNLFDSKKINKVNGRKEFFKVPLDEIEKAIKEQGLEAQFISIPEARDYRESLRIEKSGVMDNADEKTESDYPETLFNNSFSI